MNKTRTLFLISLAAIFIVELLSLTGFLFSPLMNIATVLVVIATVGITLRKPAYGFIILLCELFVGSQGYLLYLQIGAERLSLRIILWICVMTIWLVSERKNWRTLINKFNYWLPLSVLGLTILIALVHGLALGNDTSLIFTELKRWVYLVTLWPILVIFKNKNHFEELWPCLGAALLWVALKTFFVLFIFTHDIDFSRTIYQWTRNNLLGEITLLPNGFSRVFLQSQVFAIAGFFSSFIFFIKNLDTANWKLRRSNYWYGLVAAAFLAVIITSLSRSFWVGTGATAILSAILSFFIFRPAFKKILYFLAYLALVVVLNFALLGAIIAFPFPRSLQELDPSVLTDRATQFEAGAASRWSLLPIMYQAIIEEPFLGKGLGATLTYTSSDPRVRQSSIDGTYTTNAFEWGWLDIWLKLGIIGLAAYAWFLWALLKISFREPFRAPQWAMSAFAGLLALVILHFFTPYLNHPLGFGYLALAILAIQERFKGA